MESDTVMKLMYAYAKTCLNNDAKNIFKNPFELLV